LEDEEEAEMVDIMSLLDKIREANQKEYQSLEIMQDQCPNVTFKNVPLGDNKVDYLQINCSKAFQNAEIDEERINSLIKVELKFGSNLRLSPSEKSLVYSQTTLGDAIAYQFHEVKKSNTVPLNIEMTDNFLFEFAILKKDKEKFEEYLFPEKAPIPGDPLISMNIVGTILETNVGGTYGCVRWTDDDDAKNCDAWKDNIPDFPTVTEKNKVHDGIDLLAPIGTPVYAMFDGIATVATSTTLGNYVLIKSTKDDHMLTGINETIWSSYGHLSSSEDINGKEVKQGQLIGYTGNTGSTASGIDAWRYHLHLTIYKGGTDKYNRVNPISYITTKFDSNGNKIN
jgi:hypothetical protein